MEAATLLVTSKRDAAETNAICIRTRWCLFSLCVFLRAPESVSLHAPLQHGLLPCSSWWQHVTRPPLGTGDNSDACFVHGGELLFVFCGGVYKGPWTLGNGLSGPGADPSLTPGRATWELATGQCPAASWPSVVHNQKLYRLRAKAWGAGALSYTRCGRGSRKAIL